MHEVGRSSPVSPHEAAEEALAAVACTPTPNPENHAFLRRFDLSVWQGVLPEKFVSQSEVELWEARVHEKVQVLLSEKQEQMKHEANQYTPF